MFEQRIDIDNEKEMLKLCNSHIERLESSTLIEHIETYKEDLEEGIDSDLINRILISVLKQELNKRAYKDLHT